MSLRLTLLMLLKLSLSQRKLKRSSGISDQGLLLGSGFHSAQTTRMRVEVRTYARLIYNSPIGKTGSKAPGFAWKCIKPEDIMKKVNMDELLLVHCGEPWGHEQPPCSRQMIHFLERNEDVVTWVQASEIFCFVSRVLP